MKMSDVFGLPLVVCRTNPQMITAKPTYNGKTDFYYATIRSPVELEVSYAAHAINNHDCLTKENADLKTDRDNAISKMSKSWQHNSGDHPDLLTKFVDMANRQFDERDKLAKENAELREALRNMIRIVKNRPDCHYLEVFEHVEMDDANELLNKTEQ